MPKSPEILNMEGQEVERGNRYNEQTQESLKNLLEIKDHALRAFAFEGAVNGSSSFLLENNPKELLDNIFTAEELKADESGWLEWRLQGMEEVMNQALYREKECTAHMCAAFNDQERFEIYPQWIREARKPDNYQPIFKDADTIAFLNKLEGDSK